MIVYLPRAQKSERLPPGISLAILAAMAALSWAVVIGLVLAVWALL